MPRIEDALQRESVDAGFNTPNRTPAYQAPSNVMFARGGRVVGVDRTGEPWDTYAKLANLGAGILFKQSERAQEEDLVRGKMLQMQGTTWKELNENGESAATLHGYKAMEAATIVNTWYGAAMSNIEQGDKELDPDTYRDKLMTQFRDTLGDNQYGNRMLTLAAEHYMPKLAAAQMRAHAAWAHGRTMQAYGDNLLSVAASGGDVTALIKANPADIGLSVEEHQALNANAAVLEMTTTGKDSIFKAMTGGMSSTTGRLGELSAKYESSGASSTIGRMSTDGRAFGKYQISEKAGTFDAFIKWVAPQDAEVADRLRDPKTREEQWKQLVAEGKVQRFEEEFQLVQHYRPALNMLKPDVRQFVESSPALQEALFSTAVQHGPGSSGGAGAGPIFNKVFRQGMTEEEFVDAVYEERKTRFQSSTAKERASVQERLEKEKHDVLSMLGIRNLSAADLSGMYAAHTKWQNQCRTEMSSQVQLDVAKLKLQISSGEITPEQGMQKWEQYINMYKKDSRYSTPGMADYISMEDVRFKGSLLSVSKPAQNKNEQEQRVREALANGTVYNLDKRDQELAWTITKQALDVEGQKKLAEFMQQGMSKEDATTMASEWAFNAWLLSMRELGVVDTATAKQWNSALVGNIFDDKGVLLPEAGLALKQFSALYQISPVLAEQHIKNTAAKTLMYTANALYQTTGSEQQAFLDAVKMIEQGSSVSDLYSAARRPDLAEEIDERIADRLEDMKPGIWSTIFGTSASGIMDVWEDDIKTAIDSWTFRRNVAMHAGYLTTLYPGIPPEAAAAQAVDNTLSRSEFVVGHLIVQKQPKEILSAMGLERFGKALTVNDAVTKFLEKYGGTEPMWGNKWDASSWRGVPSLDIRYDATNQVFYFRPLLNEDTMEYGSVRQVPAKTIGEFYLARHTEELNRRMGIVEPGTTMMPFEFYRTPMYQ